MNNHEYTALVEKGQYPKDPSVPIDEPFVNGNGLITNLITEKFTHAAVISSREGSVRANHYHKTDWHYAFVLRGTIEYNWRPVGSKKEPECRMFTAGQMFFTPPMLEHAMFFPESTIFVTFAKNERSDHQTHEDDLVRIPLIIPVWNLEMSTWESQVNPEALK